MADRSCESGMMHMQIDSEPGGSIAAARVMLDLDGQTMFVGDRYWVKFEVTAVVFTPQRPHGLR
jgi:hypothetical protein